MPMHGWDHSICPLFTVAPRSTPVPGMPEVTRAADRGPDPRPVDTRSVRDYTLDGLVEHDPDQIGRLTPAGWALYNRAVPVTVPSVDLSEYA
ncbi:hypothetical protein [Kitasatospora sp. NPDC091207]|uniref:hypothetical protein n=1 Tax=Kitasatospora sp. NPDC091207 TaxID=3364083 RepID=UPI00381073E5